MADKTLVGINLCRYHHLRTRDAPILAFDANLARLVGMLLEVLEKESLFVARTRREGIIAHRSTSHLSNKTL